MSEITTNRFTRRLKLSVSHQLDATFTTISQILLLPFDVYKSVRIVIFYGNRSYIGYPTTAKSPSRVPSEILVLL